MNDPNAPDNRTLIIGPIDTAAEMNLILTRMRLHFQQRQPGVSLKPVEPSEVDKFLLELKNKRIISGPVDTPIELELLMEMLKKTNKIVGAVDTPAEAKIFTDKLINDGFLAPSIARVKPKVLPKPEFKPRKRKQHRDDEDDYRPTPP